MKLNNWDESLGLILRKIVHRQKGHRQDYVLAIGSPEGHGKSTLALEIIKYLDLLRGSQTPIKHIALTLDDFFRALAHSPDNSIFLLDEGRELSSQNWQDAKVKEFRRTITEIRYANNIYIINYTNPADLLGYLRDDKLLAVLMVRKLGSKHLCYGYDRKRFARILDDMTRKRIDDILKAPPNFICPIPKYDGPLWDDYIKLKETHVALAKKRAYEKFKLIENEGPVLEHRPKIAFMTAKQACEQLGCSKFKLQDLTKRGILTAYKVPGSSHNRWDAEQVRQCYDAIISGNAIKPNNASIQSLGGKPSSKIAENDKIGDD